eukprot:TRINITY_DN2799_c0_g2_i2.p1 TRINITY_DN2799_c0_g2~~TRINITY_DN2799_c0_g2_i2.p1  ORF type:complete len:163 (+),score=24.70 TRINITY_DN2799_c0_g2_i2:119-607(+)
MTPLLVGPLASVHTLSTCSNIALTSSLSLSLSLLLLLSLHVLLHRAPSLTLPTLPFLASPRDISYAQKGGKYDRAYTFVSGAEAFHRNLDPYGRKVTEKNPLHKEKDWHPFVVEGDPTGRDFRPGDPVGVTLFGAGTKYGIQAVSHFMLDKAERRHRRDTDR